MHNSKLYYKIGEVSEMLGVNASLIRFWEKEFPNLKPRKNRRGSRVFTIGDIEEIKKVYNLVKSQGHTLEGAKKVLKNNKNPNRKILDIEQRLLKIRDFLVEIKKEIS
ncbi:MAG: MerR family transcriptional regulator [Bacteroidetes bacterium]|jgi:DNA-binding transcriptional MerR regulator|nr:MerR family transcriptional regulator [Bacteroidota bacterium]